MKKILLIALNVISFVQTNKAQHTINGKVVDALSPWKMYPL